MQAVPGQAGGPVAQDDAAGKARTHGTVHIADGPLDTQMIALACQYGFGGLIRSCSSTVGSQTRGSPGMMLAADRVGRPEQARGRGRPPGP